jgi:hypothetical protein
VGRVLGALQDRRLQRGHGRLQAHALGLRGRGGR